MLIDVQTDSSRACSRGIPHGGWIAPPCSEEMLERANPRVR